METFLNFEAQTNLVEARGLVKRLSGKEVVRGIDLSCRPGEVLGLLGPNGAGKTTTLRMCYGYLLPDAGYVKIVQKDLQRESNAARRLLGVCTQDDTFDTDFTVKGNLLQTGRYYRPGEPNLEMRIEELLVRFGLDQYRDDKPDTLSGGYKRRLMIARAVVHNPRVLFLDEPTTGLDPQARIVVWELIDSLRREGLGIVLTTHYMDEAARLSDRLQVLQAGKVRAEGAPSTVLGDIVGEHIVLISAHSHDIARVIEWCKMKTMKPTQVLSHWHVALNASGLSEFVAAFPHLDYEVRRPNLDDLFLALSNDGVS